MEVTSEATARLGFEVNYHLDNVLTFTPELLSSLVVGLFDGLLSSSHSSVYHQY